MQCRTMCVLSLGVAVAHVAVRAQAQPAAPPGGAEKAPATAPTPPPGPPPPSPGGAAPAPAPTPSTPPKPPEGGAPASGPPPEYYIEAQPPADRAAPPPEQPAPPAPTPATPPVVVYEPPPPGAGQIYEPPPPPVPRHLAPKTSLWLGARLGWFIPFGNVYTRGTTQGQFLVYEGVPWDDYASSGPMFELDAGLRLSRNYNVFALWERAELGSGDLGTEGGDTDFWGGGLRASSNADRIGFLTEIALGYRRARSEFEDGTELQFTDGILEARLGIGADIRLNPFLSLSPLLTLGVGSFGDIDLETPDGRKTNYTGPLDESDGHAWFTFSVGAHFDVASSSK